MVCGKARRGATHGEAQHMARGGAWHGATHGEGANRRAAQSAKREQKRREEMNQRAFMRRRRAQRARVKKMRDNPPSHLPAKGDPMYLLRKEKQSAEKRQEREEKEKYKLK